MSIENDSRFYDEIEEQEEVVKVYKETDKYIIFSYKNVYIHEFTNNTLFKVVEVTDTEETVVESINYDVSTYIKNKVYKTNNSFENNILIAFSNLAIMSQDFVGYHPTAKICNDSLKEEDKNVDTLTDDSVSYLESITTFESSVTNETDSYLTDNGLFDSMGFSLKNFQNLTLVYKFGKQVDSSKVYLTKENTEENEFIKYGVLLFDEEIFDTIETTDNYTNLNINTKKCC